MEDEEWSDEEEEEEEWDEEDWDEEGGVMQRDGFPLVQAARSGDVEEVRQLLDAGWHVDVREYYGDFGPFGVPCEDDYPFGGDDEDFEAEEIRHDTALIAAGRAGHVRVVALLLERGADVHVRADNPAFVTEAGESGDTALFPAAGEGHLGVVELLLENGADVHAKGVKGYTALHSAAEGGNLSVAALLVKKGANVSAKDTRGLTPLHCAVTNGRDASDGYRKRHHKDYRGVVELLATHGADVTARDRRGWTPIHRAAEPGRDWAGNPKEPDVGIINYLLRETGAIVPLAKNVVEAHYRRERGPVAHRTRGVKRRHASS